MEAASVDDESEGNQGEEGGLNESRRRESSDSSEEGAGDGYSAAEGASTEEGDFDALAAREIERERAMSMDDVTLGLTSS